MIRCKACESLYPSDAPKCLRCSWAPGEVDGFTAWAPELTTGGTALRDEAFGVLSEYESHHFWFRARNELIVAALGRHVRGLGTFLEIGCGTGAVLSAIAAAFPAATLMGTELSTAGLKVAAGRLGAARLMQMDARHIPYEAEFDAIGAFDVIEHIEEDEAVLEQMRSALVPHGLLVLTVPQHRWLWSNVDVYSRHVRRYSRAALVAKLQRAGFLLEHVTSFMTLVLPALLLSRVMTRDAASFDPSAELKIGHMTNTTFGLLCAAEARAIAAGWSLPIGGSLLAIARRIG